MKITRLQTLLVKPRWLFLEVHTDEGIVGLGEPILEGRAKTCAVSSCVSPMSATVLRSRSRAAASSCATAARSARSIWRPCQK